MKTDKEIQELADLISDIDMSLAIMEDYSHGEKGQRITEMRAKLNIIQKLAYQEIKEDGGWISVEERLPEIGEEVNVYCPQCGKKITSLARFIRYEGAKGFYWDNSYGGSNIHIQDTVTHWRPLPEPPKK